MAKLCPEMVAEWSKGTWDPGAPCGISGAGIDSRTMARDSLFFALKGEHADGHEYVASALQAGASAAVVEQSWPGSPTRGGSLLRVQDPGRALTAIGLGYRDFVNPHVIGVTGSAGKTSVKGMVAAIFRRCCTTGSTRGNWNNALGLPLSLLAMEPDTRVAVLEVGTNHPGEIGALCKVAKPDWGIVTNVGAAHIGNFADVDAIAHEKSALLESLPPEGFAFLDLDGSFFSTLADACPCRIVTVSCKAEADFMFVGRDRETGSVRIRERSTGDEMEVRLPVVADFAIRNALLAVAAGRTRGITWTDIRDGLETFAQEPMRWEIQERDGLCFINDSYNANPVSMRAALQAFADRATGGKRVLVIGGMLEMGNLEEEEHLSLGEIIAVGPWDGLVVVGRLGGIVAAGARSAGMDEGMIFEVQTHRDAAAILRRTLGAGDAVLLKASRGEKLEEVITEFEQIEKP